MTQSVIPGKIENMPPKKNTIAVTEVDREFDQALRPKRLEDYVGQQKIKKNLNILLSAAKKRKQNIEHLLLYGPPGLGKTTLAHIISREMEAAIRVTSGPAITKAGDLASILTNLEKNDILFIDEIHRLNKTIEETLYSAMEDQVLDLVIGKGPSARTMRLDLNPFTVIGATTRIGLLSSPLRNRFGSVYRLEFYDENELAEIVRKNAKKLKVVIDEMAAKIIGKRSRGTPRIANRLLKRVRDYIEVNEMEKITEKLVEESLKMLDVDELGLDDSDRRLIRAIIEKYGGGPVGIETLAATLSEDVQTIEEVLEPFLMQIGFLKRTPQGRVATPHAYRHLKITPPKGQEGLF